MKGNERVFFVATTWNTHFELGVDDGQGNIPKEIRWTGSYYEITFTHNKYKTLVHTPAYAKYGTEKKERAH